MKDAFIALGVTKASFIALLLVINVSELMGGWFRITGGAEGGDGP